MAANLEVYKGGCLPISLVCKQSTGALFDLTGYTVGVRAKWGEGSDEYEDIATVANGGALGTVTGEFTAAQVEKMPEGKLTRVHLHLTQPAGCLKPIFLGRVRVRT
ncbi:MAG: hypothetical protein AAGF48_12950 [Pseudomonadota bacterium]